MPGHDDAERPRAVHLGRRLEHDVHRRAVQRVERPQVEVQTTRLVRRA